MSLTSKVNLFCMGGIVAVTLSAVVANPTLTMVASSTVICLLAAGNVLKQDRIEHLEAELREHRTVSLFS